MSKKNNNCDIVYVLNKHGKPLMPCSNAKARILLKQGKAIIVRKTPFTIKLKYGSSGYTQPIDLGVDSGSKVAGFSATTKNNELYASELTLRNDITELISTKRECRKTRRNRLRYRAPRFNNRVRTKKKGWLAPSIQNKINSHLSEIELICSILPIRHIYIEVAAFDTQLLQNPDIENLEYQKGPQFNFWNVREYVLYRDKYTCRHCKGKSKDKILNVHHIESRKTGGNAPNNLICLCESCHHKYHKGLIELNIKRGDSYKDASFMSIMRWYLYNNLCDIYSKDFISMTYGYITKSLRIANGLPKTHYIDARCISGNPLAKPSTFGYIKKKVRNHNRKIHKSNILKGGKRKLNQAPFKIKGFRLYDKVKYRGIECFITGRRSSGYFKLTDINGKVIHNSASYKELKYIESRKGGITKKELSSKFLLDL